MIWKGSTKNCMRSDSGYLICRFWVVDGATNTGQYWYVPHTPSREILRRAESIEEAKARCEQSAREDQSCV